VHLSVLLLLLLPPGFDVLRSVELFGHQLEEGCGVRRIRSAPAGVHCQGGVDRGGPFALPAAR
jgi:hypothetical protein